MSPGQLVDKIVRPSQASGALSDEEAEQAAQSAKRALDAPLLVAMGRFFLHHETRAPAALGSFLHLCRISLAGGGGCLA